MARIKFKTKFNSIVHRQPRYDTAQLPVFYLHSSSHFISKGQENSFYFLRKTQIVLAPNYPDALPCMPFYPFSFPSRALSFNQVDKVIVCRFPISSSPITSFSRRKSISAAIYSTESSDHPNIRIKMARASAKIVNAEDLDSDGEDGQLVSLMGKMVVERKMEAVSYTHLTLPTMIRV